MKKTIILTLVALLGLVGPAFAQQYQSDQRMQDMAPQQGMHGRSMMMQPGQQGYYQPQQPQQPQQQRMQMQQQSFDRVQGQIKSMRTVNLTEVGEQHMLAKVQTRDGRTARVDLGPKSQISQMNIQKGDQVTIFGSRGFINDRQVLMAQRIQSDGQTFNISRSPDRDLRRFNARVLGTNTTSFSRFTAPPQLFTRVRLDTGQTTTVMMGPASEYRDVNIQKGDNIAILARPANVQGKLALVAEQVKKDGKVVDVDWNQSQRQTSGQQRQQQ